MSVSSWSSSLLTGWEAGESKKAAGSAMIEAGAVLWGQSRYSQRLTGVQAVHQGMKMEREGQQQMDRASNRVAQGLAMQHAGLKMSAPRR